MNKKILLYTLFCLSTLLLNGQSLVFVESVEYDASQNRFLISNGGSIIARASDNTLSYFGSGAANYGMEVMDGKLFAISGNFVKGYDLVTEDEVMSLEIPNAAFLNGMGNDGQNTLFVTDFGSNYIYKIDVSDLANSSFEVLASQMLFQPNGIFHDAENNRLIFVTWGSNATINALDLTDNSVSTILSTSLGNIDGIDRDPSGNYYISSWNPTRITQYDNNFENPMTIDAPGIQTPADLCYANEIDTLAIPNGNATITYVGFEIVSAVQESFDQGNEVVVYPNPVKNGSAIYFKNESDDALSVALYDLQGRKIKSLLDGVQNKGIHSILLEGVDLESGLHICRFEQGKKVSNTKLFVLD